MTPGVEPPTAGVEPEAQSKGGLAMLAQWEAGNFDQIRLAKALPYPGIAD